MSLIGEYCCSEIVIDIKFANLYNAGFIAADTYMVSSYNYWILSFVLICMLVLIL